MSQSGVIAWSTTASSNATADSAAPWPEGMAPSQVNDSARGGMASVAKWRDDISGVLATSGTSTAYTVSSNQSIESLANLDGMVIAFTPHVTNGASPTLSVSGFAAKPLRAATGVSLQSNVLLQGTPYVALYSNANGEFVLQGMTANPYGIPLGCGLDFWGTTSPSSAYAFPTGQAISRTTYAALFAMFGTTYGTGDGSTTFNLPDKTGRASVMIEGTATRLTSSYFGGDSTKIGATGGLESNSVILTHTHNNSLNEPPHSHSGTLNFGNSNTATGSGDAAWPAVSWHSGLVTNFTTSSVSTGITLTNASVGTASAHNIVQPSIACNYIMRII